MDKSIPPVTTAQDRPHEYYAPQETIFPQLGHQTNLINPQARLHKSKWLIAIIVLRILALFGLILGLICVILASNDTSSIGDTAGWVYASVSHYL
jgi:hypothetical protein